MSTTLAAGTATSGAALSSDTSGILQFQTGSTPTTNMTLDASGNFYVGTTSQVNGTNINFVKSTSGNLMGLRNTNSNGSALIDFLSAAGLEVGYIATSSSATTYATSSDARLKTLIGVATDTSVIDNIVINDFTWKTDGTTDRGVFAQDAVKIKPTAVTQKTDNTLDQNGFPLHPWGVDYSKFIPDLIVYCQQLKKQVTELSAEVTALKAKVGA